MRRFFSLAIAILTALPASAGLQAAESPFSWPTFRYGRGDDARYKIVPVRFSAGCGEAGCGEATCAGLGCGSAGCTSADMTAPGSPETGPMPQDPGMANLGNEQFAASGGNMVSVNDVAGGYIDNPIVGTWYRSRYDAAWGNKVPDRNEFFYAKCGCFGPPAKGPPAMGETNIDYQEMWQYVELAPFKRLSFFADVPVRSINPDANLNHTGLGDIQSGFKFGVVQQQNRYVTFQLKTYAPSGDANAGLGTGHTSIEPGLLFWRQISNRAFIQGETRYWIPIGGSDFAGDVIRYGAGMGYDVVRRCDTDRFGRPVLFRVTPVAEVVAWTMINGQYSTPDGLTKPSDGITIANTKLGVRLTKGVHSVYGGWGFAMTHNTWYNDIVRFEYRRAF